MTHHSKGLIEENTMHYILKLECSEVMQTVAIISFDYKVSYKCSSNYYHFSSRVTFIFVNRVIFAVFFSL